MFGVGRFPSGALVSSHSPKICRSAYLVTLISSVVFKHQPDDKLKKVNQSIFYHLNISVPLAQEGDERNKQTLAQPLIEVIQAHARWGVILSSCSCRTKVSLAHICAWRRLHTRTRFLFCSPPYIFFFLVQFNSCPNLPSNYANEFVVGGSPSRLSGDLGSLGWEQKVSLAHVWQRKSSSRKEEGQRKKREEAATEERKRVQRLTQFS